MKKILVPTDFSEQAENALNVAVQLCKKYDAELHVVHYFEMQQHLALGGQDGNLPESIYYMKLAEKRIADIESNPIIKEVPYHAGVEVETVYEGINKTIERNNIDMVVIGSHGASGFKEMFIGSNTEKVVRSVDVPVLVIKEKQDVFTAENFVYATDFTDENIKAFQFALSFAKDIDATIHLLYVNTPSKFKTSLEIEARIAAFLSNYDIPKHTITIYNDRSVESGILNFAKKIDADLIGMATHGRKGLSHFLNGSISEDLVNHARKPVVTFKIK